MPDDKKLYSNDKSEFIKLSHELHETLDLKWPHG